MDTGVGVHSLRKFLDSSGLRPEPEKPLEVVLTHCHFDHSGGAHQFDRVHCHWAEARYVREADKFLTTNNNYQDYLLLSSIISFALIIAETKFFGSSKPSPPLYVKEGVMETPSKLFRHP